MISCVTRAALPQINTNEQLQSSMVGQWLALSPHSKKVLCSIVHPNPFIMKFEWVFSMFPATALRHAKSSGLERLNCPQGTV